MRYFSVVAQGVYPYITASIIVQLLVPVILLCRTWLLKVKPDSRK